jgi:hypothetical protein
MASLPSYRCDSRLFSWHFLSFETTLIFSEFLSPGVYRVLVACVLSLHALFILWVALGAAVAYSRPVLRWLHTGSLIWGILIEVFPWVCPLTFLENWLQIRAGVEPYHEGFLLHYVDRFVYPDISPRLLTVVALTICILNLGFYAVKWWSAKQSQSNFQAKQRE